MSDGFFSKNERIFTTRKRSLRRLCFHRCLSTEGVSILRSGGVCGGGVCDRGHVGEHVWQGVCMAEGMHGRGHAWQGHGACMAGGHAWQGGMHGRGACVGGVHGRGVCVAGKHVWQGCAWQGGHAWQGSVRYRREGHCSGRYASYWNAVLSETGVHSYLPVSVVICIQVVYV